MQIEYYMRYPIVMREREREREGDGSIQRRIELKKANANDAW